MIFLVKLFVWVALQLGDGLSVLDVLRRGHLLFFPAAMTVVVSFFCALLQWAVRNVPLRHGAEKTTLEASRENGQRLVGRAQQQGSFHQRGLLRNSGSLVAVPRSQQGQSRRNAFETRSKRDRNEVETHLNAGLIVPRLCGTRETLCVLFLPHFRAF